MDVAVVIAAILLIGGVAAWLATGEIPDEELEDDELFDDLPHAPDGGALNRDP